MTLTSPLLHTAAIDQPLLRWFDRHGRKTLPWRKRDAYAIWVAEIMLQQTQVNTVIPYYRKFIARFPDIKTLARCDVDVVLHHWSGLGYYARARNLHAAAQQIMAQHDGKFPDQFEQVLALPGIGRSTAGAILAFACGQRHPILDGNVKRVLTRYYAIAGYPGVKAIEAQLWQLADQLTPKARVGDYTQAIMDLGASVCTRTKPRCTDCPLVADCRAYQMGDVSAYPERKPRAARRCKAVTMLIVQNQRAELLLVKRPPSGIWGGLWSLPEYAAPPHEKPQIEPRPIEHWFAEQFGLAIKIRAPLPPFRHSFTHFDLDIVPLPATLTKTCDKVMEADPYLWYNPVSPAQIGLPTAVTRILEMFDEP